MTYKTTKTILFASMFAAILVSAVLNQSAEATECPYVGQFGESRCYAVKNYDLSVQPSSVNVDLTADDIAVGFGEGTLQNSLWTFLTDGRFIETGLQDQSSNNEKVLCGDGGGISNWQTIDFTDGSTFNAYSLKLSSGLLWKTGIKWTNHSPTVEPYCNTSSPSGTNMVQFMIGSEATRTEVGNYEHDWADLEIDYNDVVSTQFSDTDLYEYGTGWDVEECGTGNTQYRHIQTGKGDLTSC